MSDIRPRPSIERIVAFKEVVNLVAEQIGEDTPKGQATLCISGALCWSSGCNCQGAEAFETQMLLWAEKLSALGALVDKHGNPIDLIQALATGIKQE